MANNRASCGSYLSDEELVIIRLGLPSTASTPTTNNNIGFVYSQFFNIFEFCYCVDFIKRRNSYKGLPWSPPVSYFFVVNLQIDLLMRFFNISLAHSDR